MSSGSSFEFVVIGAGIAGASAAWQLAQRGSVAVVEQASVAGFHASGRSASVLSETSGHRVVCALAAASRAKLSFIEASTSGVTKLASSLLASRVGVAAASALAIQALRTFWESV